MSPGFALFARKGCLDIGARPASHSRPSRLLTWARADGEGALLLGRLHYVAEYCARLADPRVGPGSSHAAVALAGYRAEGLAALERLEGEFSLLVWNLKSRVVLAMRDPLGAYPLFWCEQAGSVAVSTRMRPLIEFLQDAKLDVDFLADYLTRPVPAMQEPPSEACCYRGVRRVLPGTIVTLRLSDGEVTRSRHWRWPELVVDPASDQTNEIAEQVEPLFRQAVRERIDGRTASHLSGGMDSTSVALIARNLMQAGSGETLHALSLIYDRLPSLSGETRYVHAALRGQLGITPHFVRGDELLAYDSFVAAPILDEPSPQLFDLAKDLALFAAADAAGVETVLTGDGGDDLLDIPPFVIADLLRRGRLRAAWQESVRRARAFNTDAWPIFYRYGLEHAIPPSLRAGPRALLSRGIVGWRGQGVGTLPPWIRRSFPRKHDLRGRSLHQFKSCYQSTRHVGLAMALAGIQYRTGECRRWALASPRGMGFSQPFLDARLLRLGLGIQLRYRQEPGQQKPLLAHAMRDVLPAEIRTRRAKGHFNEVYYRGLARHRPALEELVRAAPIDDLDMIDKETLIACLRETALGAEYSPGGSTRLNSTLSLVKWLSMQRRPGGISRDLSFAPILRVSI